MTGGEGLSTKQCPKCGNEALGLIRTQHMKFCPDCDTWFDWNLDPGQKPLLRDSREVDKKRTN